MQPHVASGKSGVELVDERLEAAGQIADVEPGALTLGDAAGPDQSIPALPQIQLSVLAVDLELQFREQDLRLVQLDGEDEGDIDVVRLGVLHPIGGGEREVESGEVPQSPLPVV